MVELARLKLPLTSTRPALSSDIKESCKFGGLENFAIKPGVAPRGRSGRLVLSKPAVFNAFTEVPLSAPVAPLTDASDGGALTKAEAGSPPRVSASCALKA